MEQPYCEPKCKQLEKVNNTVVSCSSGSDLGSTCTFNCIGEDDKLIPEHPGITVDSVHS